MALSTQTFTSIISNWASAAKGACSSLVDFTIGSVLRAIDEATAYVALWLQGLALQAAAIARASTSSDTDLDSWFAQFGFSREAAVAATMLQTFARYTPTNSATILTGVTVSSYDGTVTFSVIADTTNSYYSSIAGGYVVPAGTASINVTVQCTAAGAAGNVAAGTITALNTSISGIDYTTNPNAAINGSDAETDAAARTRFIAWVASLSAATLLAVKTAVANIGQNMSALIQENQLYNGTTQRGYFTAIINNGSGTATSAQLASAATAIEAVRPLAVTYGVFAPTSQQVNASMAITSATGYTHSTVVANVVTALQTYIASIQTTTSGATLPYTQLAAVAYGVAGVTNVSGVLLNGGTEDLTITYEQCFAAGTLAVT